MSTTYLFADVTLNVSKPTNYILAPCNPNDKNIPEPKNKNIIVYNEYNLGINTSLQPFTRLNNYLTQSRSFDACALASNEYDAFLVTGPIFLILNTDSVGFVLTFSYPQYEEDENYKPFPNVNFIKNLQGNQNNTKNITNLYTSPAEENILWFPYIASLGSNNQIVVTSIGQQKDFYFFTAFQGSGEDTTKYQLDIKQTEKTFTFAPLPLQNLTDGHAKNIFIYITYQYGGTNEPTSGLFVYDPLLINIPTNVFSNLQKAIQNTVTLADKFQSLGLLWFVQGIAANTKTVEQTSCIFGFRNSDNTKNNPVIKNTSPPHYNPSDFDKCPTKPTTDDGCTYCS